MGIGSANPLLLASAASGGDSGPSDPVTRSLRLAGSHYLTKSFSSDGDRKTYTIAFWVKRSKVSTSSTQVLFSAAPSSHSSNPSINQISFRTNDTLEFYQYPESQEARLATAAVFRDVGAWMHCCFSVDTTQSTEANRVKIFVNGVLQSVATYTDYPSQDHVSLFNSTYEHKIGEEAIRDRYNSDVLISDFYFIDGTALSTPVGNLIEDTGYSSYKPKAFDMSSYSGNSFHIDAQPAHDADLLVSSVARNDGDTTFADAAQGHGLVAYGSTHHDDTVGNPFDSNGTAIHFDGSGDYIKVWDGSSGDYDFGTADYTIECWVNLSSQCPQVATSCYNTIFSNSNTGLHLFERGGEFYYYTSSDGGSNPSNGLTGYTTDTWYHVAAVRDGTDIRLYINGKCSLNYTWNGTTDASTSNFRIGGGDDYYLDGYIYDFRVTGGEAKYSGTSTASDWANFDEITAPFESNPVYIGGDQSGNKNHFTPTNISGHDVLLDTPTKNYATLNPVSDVVVSGSNTFSEGNLTADSSHTKNKIVSTIAVSSGKWYAEARFDDNGYQMVGIGRVDCLENTSTYIGGNGAFGYMLYKPHGDVYHNASGTSIWGALSTGDVIQIALDLDNNKVWWGKNGTWNGTVGSSGETSISAGEYYFAQSYRDKCTWNFGQDNTFRGQETGTPDNDEFLYEIPAGFKSLNTSNLDAPAVTPAEHFEALTYSGSGSSRSITGLDFEPSLVWLKDRTTGGSSGFHCIHDSVRGDDGTHKYILSSDNTITTDTTYSGYGVTSFNSDGFSIINGGSLSNDSSRNYVAWNWKAHQSPSSGSGSTTTYTVKVEDNSDDAWDSGGSYYDGSYFPTVYMELFENRNSSLVSLGSVAVRSYDDDGNDMSDYSEQTYTLQCADLDAIAVKWHYDTSGDGDEYDYPYSYNDYLNDQKITILDGTTSEWTTNNHSNDDGTTENYSPPTGWADGDTLKSATTSYNGSDTATLTSDSGSSGPTEKYNAAAGFTIISYSGDGASDGDSQTLDHSLGVPLEFVIVKARTNNDGYNDGDWVVYHKDLPSGDYLTLNSTSASDTPYYSNDLIATSVSGSQHSVVVSNDTDSANTGYLYLNSGPDISTGEDYILYGWASVEGMVKVGSWVGNGSTDGPMVYCGFRPSLILAKAVDRSNSWYMWDDQRDGYNVTDAGLWADLSNAESNSATNKVDILSNGFKLRGSGNGTNSSTSNNYIFIAWAHSPFKHANAR